MNRRQLLLAGATTASASLAGCTANENTGRTYALRMTETSTDPDDPLDLESAGITPNQEDIVRTAIREDAYAEENVNWDTLPGREGITMQFKLLIQMFARHAGRDPTVDEPTRFEIVAEYDRSTYDAVVDVEA